MRIPPLGAEHSDLNRPTPVESQSANPSTLEVKVQGAVEVITKPESENKDNNSTISISAPRYNLFNFCSSATAMVVVNLVLGLAALLLYHAHNKS